VRAENKPNPTTVVPAGTSNTKAAEVTAPEDAAPQDVAFRAYEPPVTSVPIEDADGAVVDSAPWVASVPNFVANEFRSVVDV
jgi:hypothetical protein